MADKKLTIALDGKVSPSIQTMMKTLEAFEKSANKVSSGLATLSRLSGAQTGGGAIQIPGIGGAGAGGGALQAGGLAKGLLGQKKLFDDLGKSGIALSKVLNEQVNKAQAALQKSLGANAVSFAPLIKQYEAAHSRVTQLQAIGADPARIALAQKYAGRAGGAVLESAAVREQMLAASGELGGSPAPAPGGGRGGFGGWGGAAGALVSRAGVPMGGALMAMGGPAAVAAIAAAAAIVVGKMVVTNAAGLTDVRAASGGSMAQITGQSGNVAYQSGRREMETNRRAVRVLDQSTIPGFVRAAPASALNLLTSLQHIGGEGYWKSFDAKQDQDQLERNQEMLDKLAAARGPMAVAAQVRLDEAAQRFAMEFRHGQGSFERVADLAAKSGMPGLGEHMGTLSQSVGARSAEGYLGRVVRARNQGVDPGQAAGIIGKSAVGGINALDYSHGFDPMMRGIFGEATVANMGPGGAMYAGRGAAFSEALSNAVNFSGGAAGVRQAQQAVSGFGLLSARAGGHDPYQSSANIAAASAALGPGATPYAREFLATQLRDPDHLAKIRAGTLPPSFKAMDITIEQAQAAARALDRTSTGARYIDNPRDQSPAAVQMRAFKAAGGVSAWAKDKTNEERQAALEVAAPIYGIVHKGATGGDIGVTEGLLAAEMGLGGRAKPGSARAAREMSEEEKAKKVTQDTQRSTLWDAHLVNLGKENEQRVRLGVAMTNSEGKFQSINAELDRFRKQGLPGVLGGFGGMWRAPVFAPRTEGE